MINQRKQQLKTEQDKLADEKKSNSGKKSSLKDKKSKKARDLEQLDQEKAELTAQISSQTRKKNDLSRKNRLKASNLSPVGSTPVTSEIDKLISEAQETLNNITKSHSISDITSEKDEIKKKKKSATKKKLERKKKQKEEEEEYVKSTEGRAIERLAEQNIQNDNELSELEKQIEEERKKLEELQNE